MSITRKQLAFERNRGITEIPNTWTRDKRLSRRARGLLTELLSHSEGWKTSTTQLLQQGPEGKDALRSAIAELEQHGYLTRLRRRSSKGQFEVDYELSDPTTEPVDNPAEEDEFTSAENPPRSGFTAAVNPPLKKDQIKEELEQSSNQLTLVGAVDNFDDDQLSHPVIHFPTPSNVRELHPTAIDRAQLATSVGYLFVDAGISDDQLHQLALEILGKATSHVSNPTKYVITSIRNDSAVYQRRAFDMAADLHSRGGNPF